VTGPAFLLTGIGSGGYQRKSIALDPARVQAWVSDPAQNQGLVLVNQASGKVLRMCSSESTNLARRPTLSITFE
jgi:hypothetical protein